MSLSSRLPTHFNYLRALTGSVQTSNPFNNNLLLHVNRINCAFCQTTTTTTTINFVHRCCCSWEFAQQGANGWIMLPSLPKEGGKQTNHLIIWGTTWTRTGCCLARPALGKVVSNRTEIIIGKRDDQDDAAAPGCEASPLLLKCKYLPWLTQQSEWDRWRDAFVVSWWAVNRSLPQFL